MTYVLVVFLPFFKCNWSKLFFDTWSCSLSARLIGGSDYKLIYRHYATLYFVFCVDSSESELGILDLIQVAVCKIHDILFHVRLTCS